MLNKFQIININVTFVFVGGGGGGFLAALAAFFWSLAALKSLNFIIHIHIAHIFLLP